MDPSNVPTSTEAELESFRQKWRDEVTARSRGTAPVSSTLAKNLGASSKPRHSPSDVGPRSHAQCHSREIVDGAPPHVYQHLGDKQHGRRLDETNFPPAAATNASREPSSALEHYERAVEKENQGSLGDSVSLYRKAFRVSEVDRLCSPPLLISPSSTLVCTKPTKRNISRLLTSQVKLLQAQHQQCLLFRTQRQRQQRQQPREPWPPSKQRQITTTILLLLQQRRPKALPTLYTVYPHRSRS